MSNPEIDRSSPEMDWDTYWRGSSDGAAFASEGVDHPLAQAFWQRVLGDAKSARPAESGDAIPRLLDVASGTGAVLDSLGQVFADGEIDTSCLDSSDWAIKGLLERFPSATGTVGDARSMPFPDASFDFATSQFGAEYAGPAAVSEMARLLKPGGRLMLLMHISDGLINTECANNLDAILALQGGGFIAAARTMFREAQICVRGESPGNSRTAYDQSVQDLLPIFRQLESVLDQFGPDIAGGTLETLRREVNRIHSRIMHHDLDEVLTWLDTMDAEISAYAGRMQSMCDAAVDAEDFKRLVEMLQQSGFEIVEAAPLRDSPSDLPVAWALVAVLMSTD